MSRRMPEPGVALAIEAVGGSIPRLAQKLGLSRQAIHRWRRIPAERLPDVVRITGIPAQKLRPDLKMEIIA